MKFKHKSWENFLELRKDIINVVAIENVSELWRTCQELQNQSDGGEGGFHLFDDFFKEYNIIKEMLIELNMTNIVINNKRLINALLKKCTAEIVGYKYQEIFLELTNQFHELCKNISEDIGLGCRTELNPEIDPQVIFKLFDIKFSEDQTGLLERLIDKINLSIDFLNISIFIYLFPSKFLNLDEIRQLHEHCSANACSLIFIEDCTSPLKLSNLPYQAIVIDEDGFELIENINEEFDTLQIP